jgi:hypothetical protein
MASVGREIRSIVSTRWDSAAATAGSTATEFSDATAGAAKNCNMPIAKCKMQIEEQRTTVFNSQFAICNLQFAMSGFRVGAFISPASHRTG